MSLESRWVREVLEKSEIHNISFRLGGLYISPEGLQRVKNAIADGRIDVVLNNSLPRRERLQNNEKALYDPTANRIVLLDLAQTADAYGQSFIVHEAVHALVDMSHAGSTTVLTDEVAGFLAQLIFLEAVHYSRSQLTSFQRQFYDFAKTHHLFGRAGLKTPSLKRAEYGHLRQLVHSVAPYNQMTNPEELTTADGV
jgi:hypothetical protein